MKALLMTCAVLAAMIAGPPMVLADPPANQAGAAAQSAEPAVIDGYRSAHFGMTEAEVRKAIKTDLGNSDPTQTTNPTERTTILMVAGKTLIPDTPPATISYILGASSAKLFQVNVVWGENGGADVGQIASTASALTSYFMGKGTYAKGTQAVNQQLPDGSVLAFRGADAKGHAVALRFIPIQEQKDGKADAKDKQAEVKKAVLVLSYVADPGKPDVFHIEKGQF